MRAGNNPVPIPKQHLEGPPRANTTSKTGKGIGKSVKSAKKGKGKEQKGPPPELITTQEKAPTPK